MDFLTIYKHPVTHFGYVRLFVQKIERRHSFSDGHTVLDCEHFDIGLISDVNDSGSRRILTEEIHGSGQDLWSEAIDKVLKRYKLWDIIEIFADAHIEYSQNFNGESTEYDAWGALRRVKHRKLTVEQIKRFCAEGMEEIEEEREQEAQAVREAIGPSA